MDFEFSEVDDINKVPEQFRPLYTESDGKYLPNEQYKGVTEAITGLNRSLKAARAEAKDKAKGQVDLSPLKDFGETPEDIRQTFDNKLKEAQDELAKGDKAKLNLDKVRQELAEAHANDLKKREAREEALTSQLYTLLVENKATAAIAELKGVPDLLLPFVKNQVKIVEEDGQFKEYVVDEQGDRRYSGITGQPMTIKELVAEMKANEKFGRLFESDSPSGGGTPPGSGGTPPRGQQKEMSAADKIAAGLAKRQGKRG